MISGPGGIVYALHGTAAGIVILGGTFVHNVTLKIFYFVSVSFNVTCS